MMADSQELKALREQRKFADKIEVEPYGDVKRFLDDLAISTAKDTVKGLAKLFDSSETRT